MLCKVHPELYIPPLTQPIKNAPDLYHFKKLGMLFWLEDGGLWSVVCGLVCGWWSADRMVWFGGRVVMIVCCCIRMWWSDLGCDLLVWCDGLMYWFHGLIWISAWGRWCGLTSEKWKDNKVDNSEMAQLSVRELRKEKERKNMEIIYS